MPIISNLKKVLALIVQEKRRKDDNWGNLETFLDELIGWVAVFLVYEEHYFDYRLVRDDKADLERRLNEIEKLKDYAIGLCGSKLTIKFGLGALMQLLVFEALNLPHLPHPLPKLPRGHSKNPKNGYFVIMLDSLLIKHSLLMKKIDRLKFINIWLRSFFNHHISIDGVKEYLKNYEFWRPTFGMDGKKQYDDVLWLLRHQKERRLKEILLFSKKNTMPAGNLDDHTINNIVADYSKNLPDYRKVARSKIEECVRDMMKKRVQIRFEV